MGPSVDEAISVDMGSLLAARGRSTEAHAGRSQPHDFGSMAIRVELIPLPVKP